MNQFSRLKFDLYSEKQLANWLKNLRLNLHEPKQLAAKILALSDLYNAQKGSSEIWNKADHIAAYLTYFLPLNYMRAKQVIADSIVVGYWEGTNHIVDFGAGLGAFEWALRQRITDSEITREITSVEPASSAISWYEEIQRLANTKARRLATFSPNEVLGKGKTVVAFSYSLNEMPELPAWAMECEGIAIIEPSTQPCGRRVMELRQKLIDSGFSIWAPCLHQRACPLLSHSRKDWCHNRIHLEMPEWFNDVEKYLPMKNASVTYSYLLARKTPPPQFDAKYYRIIGDTLFEKGKTRQAVCQSDKRQFFSWLNKDQEAPQIPRGSLVEISSHLIEKHDELRSPDSNFQYTIKAE